ncbi:MAG: ribokinase [Planctomycetota bacterium]
MMPQKQELPRIAVLGSINMDLVVNCDSLPRPGETVSANGFSEVCGGKGANQAIAAARAGAVVSMIGRVGDDGFAGRLIENLRSNKVNVDSVISCPDSASGLAIIGVESSGENQIVIVPAANSLVSVHDVQQNEDRIAASDALLLQLEIPTAATLAAVRVAQQHGVRCILDPAPVAIPWADELLNVDLVLPNETEATAITGIDATMPEGAESAARELQRRGAQHVVITLGSRGCLLLIGDSAEHIPAHQIQPVDTTAAGDAFAGALAVCWSQTDDLRQAVRFASLAGAIAATRHGAQPSLPLRSEIESLRDQHV